MEAAAAIKAGRISAPPFEPDWRAAGSLDCTVREDSLASWLYAEPPRRPRRPGPGQRSSVLVVLRLAPCRAPCCSCHGTSASRRLSPTSVPSPTPAAFYFGGAVLDCQNPGPGYAFAAQDAEHVFLDKLLGPPVDLQRLRLALAHLGVRFVALAKVADWRDFAEVADGPGIWPA